MPIIDTVLNRLGWNRTKDVPIIGREPSIQVMGGTSRSSSSYYWQAVDYYGGVRDGYTRNSDVYACVSLIAQTGKQCKWWDGRDGRISEAGADVLRKTIWGPGGLEFWARQGNKGKAPLDPTNSLALYQMAGGPTLLEQWLSYILLTGNAYIEMQRVPGEKVSKVVMHRPDRVRANPAGTAILTGTQPGTVEAWRVELNGAVAKIVPPANMMHSRLFNPLHDIYGLPPLAAAMLRIQAQNSGGELMARMLEEGHAPGWIGATRDWDEVQVAALRRKIAESKHSREELFLEGAEWHPMQGDGGGGGLDDAILNQQALTKRDIASVFHVDPALIGDTTGRTYATYRESRQALYMEAVIPLLRQFADDWNRTIGLALQSPLRFDRDSFDAITAARQEAADRVVKLWQSGLITQAEGRDDLEYPPTQSGDEFIAPASYVPLDLTGQGSAAKDAAPVVQAKAAAAGEHMTHAGVLIEDFAQIAARAVVIGGTNGN